MHQIAYYERNGVCSLIKNGHFRFVNCIMLKTVIIVLLFSMIYRPFKCINAFFSNLYVLVQLFKELSSQKIIQI